MVRIRGRTGAGNARTAPALRPGRGRRLGAGPARAGVGARRLPRGARAARCRRRSDACSARIRCLRSRVRAGGGDHRERRPRVGAHRRGDRLDVRRVGRPRRVRAVGRSTRSGARPRGRERIVRRDGADHPHPRRPAPGPGAAARRRVDGDRLRRRAGARGHHAQAQGGTAARRRGDAALAVVSGQRGRARRLVARRARPVPGCVPRVTSGGGAAVVDRGTGPAARVVRAGEGVLRAALRARPPSRLGRHPGREHPRPARSGERVNRVVAPTVELEFERLLTRVQQDPHRLLGVHPSSEGAVVRTYAPRGGTPGVVVDGEIRPMRMVDRRGLFELELVGGGVRPRYQLRFPGDVDPVEDPYRFLPTLGELDLHLLGEGQHRELGRVLGARVMEREGVAGTSFTVWAPGARGVALVGDCNHWDDRTLPMRSLGSSGVWELFVPAAGPGMRYKFAIHGADGRLRLHADPVAAWSEVPPASASVVFESSYRWGDDAWIARRAADVGADRPMSVYEVHPGAWRPGLDWRALATELADYVTDVGFTHVELMAVLEHPFSGSWGYQVTGYFAPSARWGTPDDFRAFVDELHRRDIGVIVDWVPAHFPRDDWALARFDGTPLYEHGDPRRGEQLDWGTYVFDFGRS